MSEKKRNPNPFIRMAQEAAEKRGEVFNDRNKPQASLNKGKQFNKGYTGGGAPVQRRAARGG